MTSKKDSYYKCSICKLRFKKLSSLSFHKLIHIRGNVMKRGKSNYFLKKHIRLQKQISTTHNSFKCDRCNMSFSTQRHFDQHILSTHIRESKTKKTIDNDLSQFVVHNEPEFIIIKVDNDQSKRVLVKGQTQFVLRKDFMNDKSEIKFHCDHCDETFTTRTSLNQHLLVHDINRHFKCNECDATFIANSHLKKHKYSTHTYEHPFQCSTCKSSFKSKLSLKVHMLTHTDKSQFQCSKCDSSFALKAQLQRHMSSAHAIQGSFVCQICDASFSGRTNLKHHVLKHTNEYPFKCSKCAYRSRQKVHLKNHVLVKHVLKKFANNDIDKLLFETPSTEEKECNRPNVKSIILKIIKNSKNVTNEKNISSATRKIILDKGVKNEISAKSNCSLQDMLTRTNGFPFRCTRCMSNFIALAHIKQHFTTFHSSEPLFLSLVLSFS